MVRRAMSNQDTSCTGKSEYEFTASKHIVRKTLGPNLINKRKEDANK